MKFLLFLLIIVQVTCSMELMTPTNTPTFGSEVTTAAKTFGPELTTPANALASGAFCLDGTLPAYQLDVGFGEGSRNWIILLQGGGWCYTYEYCYGKIADPHGLGSRTKITRGEFGGILSAQALVNPYFYNWNRVYVRYCDGASFFADVEEPKQYKNNTLYFRGARIFKATVDDLLLKGMSNANNVILSGSSAGGLANMLLGDDFQAMIPHIPKVKCVADASFFIHGKDLVPGLWKREKAFFWIVDTHELANRLPKSCTSRMQDPRLCMFPEYFVEDIQTPLFMVQSAYDQYQIQYLMELEKWEACYEQGEKYCTPGDLKKIKDFGTTLVETFPKFPFSSNGYFVDSCTYHGQILSDSEWNHVPEPVLNDKTIAEAVGDWFYERDCCWLFFRCPFRVIDKANFPFNCSAT